MPNRYTKRMAISGDQRRLKKELLIKADMVLGEGNAEGMMAPMKCSLEDITGHVDAMFPLEILLLHITDLHLQ